MKARELRIGNYLLTENNDLAVCRGLYPLNGYNRYDTQEDYIILIDIYKKGKWNKGCIRHLSLCHPILLDSNILNILGFSMAYATNPQEYNCICIYEYKGLQLFGQDDVWYNSPLIIKTLSDLQNLYFSIEQKELPIKSDKLLKYVKDRKIL